MTPSLPTSTWTFDAIADDMRAIDQVIRHHLQSDVVLIKKIAEYIIHAGGKRLRPALVLLFGRAHGVSAPDKLQRLYELAAIVEFIHTATLLHDDVVDESMLRRGHQTANALFGNAASVLVGDFLYSRAFQMMVGLEQLPVMQILANATNVIAEGEVLQLMNMHDPDLTEEQYLQVIRFKTAKLFEAAAELGALSANASQAHIHAAAEYGRSLGEAFQLIDDVLDYSGNVVETGKNIGDDLREGKLTLPLIHLLHEKKAQGLTAECDLIKNSIAQGDPNHFDQILQTVQQSGSLDYTRQRAYKASARAGEMLADLPGSSFKNSLLSLAAFAVARNH